MIYIEQADISNVDDIVSIHIDAFKDFFLTSLGIEFLRLYYCSFIKSNNGIVLIAKQDNVIVGFSAATSKNRGFNKTLIKYNCLPYMFLSFKLMFTRPKALFRLVKNLTKGKNEDRSVLDEAKDYAELYSIGIKEHCQGLGIGRKLLNATEIAVKNGGAGRISLTTDYYNNEHAVNFYKMMGYSVLYVFTTYPHRKMYRFIKDLDN